MFIFYYAVLSEVSPPTALAAVASAAITGGKVDPDDVAGLEVHPARVPRPARVRDHRQRLAAARPRQRPRRHRRRRWSAARGVRRWRWSPAAGCSVPAELAASACSRWPRPCCCSTCEPLSMAIGGARPGGRGRRSTCSPATTNRARPTRVAPHTKEDGHVMKRKLPLLAAGLVASLTLVACGGQQAGEAAGAGADEDSCDGRRAAGSPSRPATPPASTTSLGGGLAKLINDETECRPPRPRPARRCRTSSSWSPATTTSRSRSPTPPPTRSTAPATSRRRRTSGARPDLLQLHPRRGPQGLRHHLVADFKGKSDLHRLAQVRHRGDRQPAAGGGRPRGHRRQGAAPRPHQDRRRHEGRHASTGSSGPAACPPRRSPTCSPRRATTSRCST